MNPSRTEGVYKFMRYEHYHHLPKGKITLLLFMLKWPHGGTKQLQRLFVLLLPSDASQEVLMAH